MGEENLSMFGENWKEVGDNSDPCRACRDRCFVKVSFVGLIGPGMSTVISFTLLFQVGS